MGNDYPEIESWKVIRKYGDVSEVLKVEYVGSDKSPEYFNASTGEQTTPSLLTIHRNQTDRKNGGRKPIRGTEAETEYALMRLSDQRKQSRDMLLGIEYSSNLSELIRIAKRGAPSFEGMRNAERRMLQVKPENPIEVLNEEKAKQNRKGFCSNS